MARAKKSPKSDAVEKDVSVVEKSKPTEEKSEPVKVKSEPEVNKTVKKTGKSRSTKKTVPETKAEAAPVPKKTPTQKKDPAPEEVQVPKETQVSEAAPEPKEAEAKPKRGTTRTTRASTNKTASKKSTKSKSDEVVFQSSDKEYTLSEITELCKSAYRGGTKKQIKSIKVYVKAENNQLKAYYVVNDSVNGSVDL